MPQGAQIRNLVIGTAGHVDHGKTSLVRSLTGIETDRWEEEKRRGITIDIGFASRELPDGRRVGFIDVPGHERFLRNMIAGATGIDLVLLVVAADDGVMPQTREHMDIIGLLGVSHGVVALTKIDIDRELSALAIEEVREFLAGTFLADAPIVPVSSKTGEGIEELWAVLAGRIAAAVDRPVDGVFRMPVQRVFTRAGFGTILTGVPVSGAAALGDQVEVLPAGGRGRIRGIQAYFRDVDRAHAGHSTGLNLSDVDMRACHRGQVVVPPDMYEPSAIVDARLRLLATATKPLETGDELKFHTGTMESAARLTVLDRDFIEPGGDALVQLRLINPAVFDRLDRFVVRQPSPAITVGGGTIIGAGHERMRSRHRLREYVTAREAASAFDETFVEHLVATARDGCIRSDHLVRAARLLPERTRGIVEALEGSGAVVSFPPGPSYAHRTTVGTAAARLDGLLARVVQERCDLPGLETKLAAEQLEIAPALFDHVVSVGVAEGRLVRIGAFVRLSSHTPSLGADAPLGHAVVEALQKAGASPPGLEELGRITRATAERLARTCDFLARSGQIVQVASGMYFDASLVAGAREHIVAELRATGELQTQSLKVFLGCTRKHLMPLLEYFDGVKVTRRDGERRIAGESAIAEVAP